MRFDQYIYRGKVVHFSTEIHVRDNIFNAWQVAYRIDTNHSEVHEHNYDADGNDRRRLLEEIPEHGWETVDRWFDKAARTCEDDWERHLERWRRSRQ